MALGRCMVCDSLRPITKLPSFMPCGTLDMGPTDHWIDTHVGCDGLVVEAEDEDRPAETLLQCIKCVRLVTESEVERGHKCSGSRKPIRHRREALPDLADLKK